MLNDFYIRQWVGFSSNNCYGCLEGPVGSCGFVQLMGEGPTVHYSVPLTLQSCDPTTRFKTAVPSVSP
jgi:hypothetical protein